MKVTFSSMAYRGGTLLVALSLAAVACSLAAVACSLTDLDGFTGGPRTTPDGGPSEASTTPGSGDAGGDASTPAGEGGLTTGDPYDDAVRADAPTSWWRFEDAAGSQTLHDEMNVHDAQVLATQENSPIAIQWGIPGAVGKAAQLGHIAGYFNVGDVFDFAGSVPFALEAWVKNETPVDEFEGIFNKRRDSSSGADTGWLLYLHKPDRELGFQFWKNAGTTAEAYTTLPPNGFHHIVVTATAHADGIEYVLFVDGAPMSSDPKNTTDELGTQANLILGFGWNGALDEIAVYEHSLTPDRVAAHYEAARP